MWVIQVFGLPQGPGQEERLVVGWTRPSLREGSFGVLVKGVEVLQVMFGFEGGSTYDDVLIGSVRLYRLVRSAERWQRGAQ